MRINCTTDPLKPSNCRKGRRKTAFKVRSKTMHSDEKHLTSSFGSAVVVPTLGHLLDTLAGLFFTRLAQNLSSFIPRRPSCADWATKGQGTWDSCDKAMTRQHAVLVTLAEAVTGDYCGAIIRTASEIHTRLGPNRSCSRLLYSRQSCRG